ncbi:MAG: protein kinase [Candidatus Koribacter versatilis]|uniref:Protein kinase n=1 Tax=Candidatus Korobacter versatilis TaxID=658062 RepID=A0A932A9U0_9BACT|nr:protein kinase [Candidatus Koribacter versatilis]
MIGSNFGNYRIDAKLGEGGMGVVYKATDTELDRSVAIKTLLSSADAEAGARFMREAKAASRLAHPAIITIHHFGIQAETRFIVMEYIDGRTLKKIIDGKPMHLNQLCEIAIQVADGLAMAHEHNVIHRDMKAENVMVTPRGQVKILDFGLAKLKEPETKSDDKTVFQTQVGVIMGTVSHMAPEQALGGEIDARADIFSFGVVLYEMSTGLMPFDGATPQAMMARVLNQEPTPILKINPEIPPELDLLITLCLKKDKSFRPTAQEVRDRLKKIQASLSSGHIAQDIRTQAISQGMAVAAAAAAPAPVSGIKTTAAKLVSSSRMPATVIQPAPGSAPRIASSRSIVTPEVTGGAKATYFALKSARWVWSIATLTVPLAFIFYFLISGGVIRPQVVEGTFLMAYAKALVEPVLRVAESVFTFRMVVNGWNLMLVLLTVVAFVLRQLVMLPFVKAENWAKTKVVRAKTAAPVAVSMTNMERASSHRLTMLREYAEAKKFLFQEKRHLAFLSIDVVGSTKMKIGEDKLTIEHAFAEYKKFVERILKANNIWKVAWTPDGIMCAFFTAQDAVKAGQEVLAGLAWFNDGIHQLKTSFNVRCGVNAGEVVFPEDKDMEDISDEAIDVAGHMQKYAAHGALWLSRAVMMELGDQTGWRAIADQKVDGHDCFEWRADGQGAAVPRGASTPSDH